MNRDETAGVLRNAPGTGRSGVVWGYDIVGNKSTLAGAVVASRQSSVETRGRRLVSWASCHARQRRG